MRANRITTTATLSLLSLTGMGAFLLPNVLITAEAAAQSNTFPLKGVLRDFRRTNPNFAVAPVGGNGHYAGNLAMDLPSDGRPMFVGGGYKVATQWRDDASHPIAPNMYVDPAAAGSTGGVIKLVNAASLAQQKGVMDTYNSALGPHGGTNKGPAPTMQTGMAMPAITIPPALAALPNLGNMSYSGTSMISANLHCDRLDGSGTITINGNISILCEDVMALSTHTVINLQPDSSLTLYLNAGASSWNHTTVGDPLKPSRVKIYNLGTANFMIHNHGDVYAQLISPNAALEMSNHGHFYGQFTGKTLEMRNHGNIHVDQASNVPTDSCGVELADVAGSKGINSDGGLVSAARFNDWFSDVMGTNLSMPHTMTLWRNSSNVWEHINEQFFPLDRKLFANQGQTHNNYFTYAATCEFTHHACAGTFFEFDGADDAWLYVNGKLVMDRGGVMPGTVQYVDMDRMGLTDGQKYRLHFFYAQRNSSVSMFRMRTNLDLIPETAPIQMSMGTD